MKLQNLQSKERAGLEDEVRGFAITFVWKNDEKTMENQGLNPLVDHHLSPEIVYW